MSIYYSYFFADIPFLILLSNDLDTRYLYVLQKLPISDAVRCTFICAAPIAYDNKFTNQNIHNCSFCRTKYQKSYGRKSYDCPNKCGQILCNKHFHTIITAKLDHKTVVKKYQTNESKCKHQPYFTFNFIVKTFQKHFFIFNFIVYDTYKVEFALMH